jgi:hypothetical protein
MRIGAFAANLAVLLLFGIGIPWLKGMEFLDLFLLIPYALLGVFYTSPRAVAVAFEPPISLSALGRAALVGWAIGVLILALGLVTVNVSAGHELLPPVPVLLCLMVLGLMACLLTAAVAVRVAMAAASESAARSRIRIGFLLLLCLFLAAPRLMGDELTGTVLGWLTPEGMVRVTMVLAPIMAVGTLFLLRVRLARYTG